MGYAALLNYIEHNGTEHYFNSDASKLVSFGIGGKCQLVIYPKDIYELCEILLRLKSEKRVILGNGTNCYFSSLGYSGTVIVTKRINSVSVKQDIISAECGASLSKICKFAQNNALSGLEFAYGIPGSLGGAITMNASAYGGEFSTVVSKSTIFNVAKEEILDISAKEHFFSTKSSIIREQDICLLKSELCLKKGNRDEISRQMEENFLRRKTFQPYNMPSAGSTFVRPKDGYASLMIDKCGLKGLRVGGAQVSGKHAGFIVNLGDATSYDVKTLIRLIKAKIFEKFNVELKEEIIFIE